MAIGYTRVSLTAREVHDFEPGTRCDPPGVTVRDSLSGGIRPCELYWGTDRVNGIPCSASPAECVAWMTVPDSEPGTRCDPPGVTVQGPLSGGIRLVSSIGEPIE